MLYLIVTSVTPRLSYTFNLVFSQILGIPYQMVLARDFQPDSEKPSVNYTNNLLPNSFFVPNVQLLDTDEVKAQDLGLVIDDIPYLFPFPVNSSANQMGFDVFSAVFYLVSEYEKYLETQIDKHGRYDMATYHSSRLHLDRYPLVHLYCEKLWQQLDVFFEGKIDRKAREFDYQLTWDIDFPWKYLNKGFAIKWAGLGKDLWEKEWDRARERLTAWRTGNDPHDTFSLIFEHCPAEKTHFFFLIDRNSSFDSRFTYRNPALRTLILSIRERAYAIGIHPSYSSFLDSSRIQMETSALSDITDSNITTARQHFLRYRLPDTYRHLVAAGITDDYTPCRFINGGFPNGMACPYPWFDLLANRETNLMLHPTQIMDRTLQQYANLPPEEAEQRFADLLAVTKQVDGTFTALFHNDSLSESEEWTGWRRSIINMIAQLTWQH